MASTTIQILLLLIIGVVHCLVAAAAAESGSAESSEERNVAVVATFPDLYSPEEKVALKKFRAQMQAAIKHRDYMKTDEFLITWLRAKHLNLADAGQMLMQALEWRRTNRIDHIMKEKFPMFEKLYPVVDGLTDRKGRPVLILPVGAWDVRKVVVSGHRDQFQRFLDQFFEKYYAELRKNFGENNPKRNITQMSSIYDMAGYNLRQHACTHCIPIYIRMIQNYEQYYPFGGHRMICINTPPIFETLLQILRPFMSEWTRASLKIYGFDKEEWKKVLLSEMSPDQLPILYGGTKKIESYTSNIGTTDTD